VESRPRTEAGSKAGGAPREALVIADLMEQAWNGETGREDAWHGPSLARLLSGVTAERARERPVAGAHTIAEIVAHVAQWDEICARRLSGEDIRTTTGSPDDWPAVVDAGEPAWPEALAWLRRSQQALLTAVRSLADAELDEPVTGWTWTKRLMIHGTLHHDLYHAGQIGLLRRALTPPPDEPAGR
jgi:uncharacterized damage-inducible protein DinB